MIKPSELAAQTPSLLAVLVPKYLDTDAIAVVEGALDETTELLKQKYDHIMYTGGEAVAKIVMRAAAEHLTPVTLALGGKRPCILDSGMNLKTVASRIIWGKWGNSGQTCVAPDYMIVEKKIKMRWSLPSKPGYKNFMAMTHPRAKTMDVLSTLATMLD